MEQHARVRKLTTNLLIGLLSGMLISSVAYGQSYVYPLKVSNNSRYLVDQNDRPFFWSGDAAWSLIAQVSKEDAVYYLEDRQQKGFNVIMVNLIEREYSDNAPRNYYGDLPFTGETFTTPNEDYFAHADYVINAAAERGIVVLLFPLYLGYQCGNDGWCNEVQAASLSDMRAWGRYVGNRYKNFDNIVWAIGADTDPTPIKSKVLEFVNGILENDSRHLFTAANQPESFAVTPWANESWLNINNVYSYSTTLYQLCRTAYNLSPTMPYFMQESAYENEHNSSQQRLRSEAYWPVLSGGFGHIFGNCPIWSFGTSATASFCSSTNWKSQLNSQGSLSMMYVQKLFNSRAWHLMVPDFSHTVMTAGYGSWGNTNYATAALTENGNTMIAYLPSSRQVTVEMSKISGTEAKSWWYNPASGSAIEIGTYATLGSRQFTFPSNGDWVLVIDDASLALPPPGSATTVAAFSAKPSRGSTPLAVNFIDQSPGDIISWNWNFGDGTTRNEQNPSHDYTEAGNYTVSLTVTGPEGSDTEIKADYINVREGKAMPWIPLLLGD